MAKFKWEVTPEQAFTELYDDYTRQIYREIQRLALKYAPEIEAWMKAERLWIDRTNNARSGLYAEVESTLTQIVISFDHTMEYGVFLEFKNQGEYAIIAPALDHFAPKFWADVQALFR
jgi:hypothetical protein